MDSNEASNEAPIPVSCKACIHVNVCGAYRAFAGALQQLKENYDFVEKEPFPAETLAAVCSEYTPPSKIFRLEKIQQ